MNVGEKDTPNVYQEKKSKDILKNSCSEEILSPTRRSSRIRKTKTSNEPCNNEQHKSNGTSLSRNLSKEKLIKPGKVTSDDQVNASGSCSDTVPKVKKDLDACGKISNFQLDNGEEESFEAMFDDIFEQRYSKTLQSLLPKKLNIDTVKERKFFKRNSLVSPKIKLSSYVCNKGNLPTEDVSKVFKIISKPNVLPDVTTESKSSAKSPLKTYSNKRRTFQKTDIIESFGLPDSPIAPDNIQPLLDKELDVTIEDVNEITILDLKYPTEPWIIAANETEDLLPDLEDVRTKSEPIKHESFNKNGSFLDFSESFDNFMEPAILASITFDEESASTALNSTEKNRKTVNKNKEIDIEAIKMNFKKMLSRTDVLELQEQNKVKINSNSLSKKKNCIVSGNSNNSSVNSDIMFVEGNSLTVENKEFEFSNNLLVPKNNTERKSKKNVEKNNFISKRKPKITKKNLQPLLKNGEEKVENTKKSKNVSRTTASRKQKTLLTNQNKQDAEDILPKKIPETDNLILSPKSSSTVCNVKEKKLEQNGIISTEESDKEISKCKDSDINKRILRSSLSSNPKMSSIVEDKKYSRSDNAAENSTNEMIRESDSKKLNETCTIKEQNISNTSLKFETEDAETRQKMLKTSCSLIPHTTEENKNAVKILVSKIKIPNKRILRSASQECLELQEKPSNLCDVRIETLDQQRKKAACTSHVKITLEKCNVRSNLDDLSLNVNGTQDITSINQDISQEGEHIDKLMSPLKKGGKKSMPEIKIILNPMDISKLNEKPPENAKNSFYDLLSPTKRKLRSTKVIFDDTKPDQHLEDLHNQPNTYRKSLFIPNNDKSISITPVAAETKEKLLIANDSIIINEKLAYFSKENVSDVKTGTQDIKAEGEKLDETKILCKERVKTTNLMSDYSFTCSSIDVVNTATLELENQYLNDSEKENKDDQKEKTVLLSTPVTTKEMHLTGLVDNEDNYIKQHTLVTNKNVTEENNSLEVKHSKVDTDGVDNTNLSECCRVPEIDSSTIPEKNTQPEQEIVIEEMINRSLREEERQGENVSSSSDTKDLNNSEISNEDKCLDKCIELQQICDQLGDDGNWTIIDSISDSNEPYLPLNNDDEYNTTDGQNSKIERNSFSNLFQTDEENTIFSISMIDNMVSSKYLDNQVRLLDEIVGRDSEELNGEDCINPDLSSDSNKIINKMTDKAETDYMIESDMPVDNHTQQIAEGTDNIKTGNNSKTKTIDDEKPHDQESHNILLSEKTKLDVSKQDMNNKIDKIVETQRQDDISSPDKIILLKNASVLPTEGSSEINVSKLNTKEESNIPSHIVKPTIEHIKTSQFYRNIQNEMIHNSTIESNFTSAKNKHENSLKKVQKHPGFNARLKEKRRKLLAKVGSVEESLKKNENITNEKSAADDHTSNSSSPDLLTSEKKRGRPKKLDVSERPNNKPLLELPKRSEILSAYESIPAPTSDKSTAENNVAEIRLTHSLAGEKKRGRPKKSDGSEIHNRSSQKLLKKNEILSPIEPTKQESTAGNRVTDIRLAQTLVGEKKRGRPKKSKGSEIFNQFSQESLKKNERISVIESTQSVTNERSAAENHETDVCVTHALAGEKKRGRPRKSGIMQTLNKSSEELLKKNENITGIESVQGTISEKSTTDHHTANTSFGQSLVGEKKYGRSRKSDITEVPNDKSQNEEHSAKTSSAHSLVNEKKRGRPRKSDITKTFHDKLSQRQSNGMLRGRPRRKSLDDMDLLNRYEECYEEKIKRSKSVARSMLEIRRKPNRRDRSDSSEYRISSHTRGRDSQDEDDDIDLLNRFKNYRGKVRSKGTVRDSLGIGKKSQDQDELKCSKKTSFTNDDGSLKRKFGNKLSKINVNEMDVGKSLHIKHASSSPSAINHSNTGNFIVGDIAWAQIGSHPFWPCLITKEPGTGYHRKTFQGKRFRRELYHVRFFGDKGRRAWITKQQIMLYSSREDLEILQNKMKSENKCIPSGFIVRAKTIQKWECAVEEAEQLKLKNIKQKLSFFVDMFRKSTSPKQKDQKESTANDNKRKSTSSVIKRKSNEHNTEETCALPLNKEDKDEDILIQKKYKKIMSSENKIEDESVKNKAEMVEDVNQVQNADDNQQNEHILTRFSLRRQIDEVSEIDSKTSSDNTTVTGMYLNTMEAQKALYKRNNLFRGISRDKVCQHCCKPGDVIKCRGKCNGSYHVSCSLKILQEKTPRKKKEKVISDNYVDDKKFEVLSNKSLFNLSAAPNQEAKVVPIKEDENCDNEEICKPLTEEEQVQIITVPSSVYNTPPRKTFPPNFKNMTLAEQIDYKMKEIMKKFESKTFYSLSESSSEEISGVQPLTKPGGLISVNTSNKIFNKNDENKIQKLEANENMINSVNGIINNIDKLTVVKLANKQSEGKSKPLAKKKLFVKHVTADSDSPKSDSALENKTNIEKESSDGAKVVDPKSFKCGFCVSDLYPYCFICHLAVSKKGSSIRQKCSIYPCGRFYHPECLKMWPQTQWSLIQTTRHKDSDKDMDSFVCPLHVCHTCVSDDPRAATSRCSGDKIVKCLRCPSTYHSSNLCIPAGTAILSSSQIICPRHREKSKLYTINTTWCFLCSEGGNLICCETCPTSVHPECLPVNLTDDDKFICEDCESGRLPLYDEIVWVKLGKFRWWPALILFPNEVPDNVKNMKHGTGEFVVKFFGTYDYYWVTRGRSFLFQEGDTGQCNTVKKKVDAAFNRAVEEAVVAHKLKKEFKLSQEVESVSSLKPPPYIRIKVNRPVGNVRHLDLDLSSTNACECDPNKPHPCGPESDCLNRLLLTECNPEVCPAGIRCKNQSFEKREYPPLVPYKTQGRGWGLKTLAPIKKGQFVIEYVGELIDSEEYQRRIVKMHEQKEENYYFLTIDKDRMIDAGPKGNAARFMNHCCQPNCETQKWTVNGDTRVGLFATEDIPADTELTFNYNLECVGKEKKVCRCGAPNCSGFIGVKAKQDSESKKPKKSVKKKKPIEPVILPPCFTCGKEGLVISCNNKVCNKTYHQECLNTTEQIEGNKFICPWHNCNICSKRTIRCCVKCTNSYCPSHSDGNVRYDNLLGFVCTTHDPMTPPNDVQPIKSKRKKNDVITEETAVTSTTSDDIDRDEDWMPLLTRLKRMNTKRHVSCDSESDNDSNGIRFSTPSKEPSFFSDQESQDESTVSSATLTDLEEEVVVKRKRGRPRKRDQSRKKIRLSNEPNIAITASSCITVDDSLSHSNSELSSRDNDLQNR